MHDLSPPPQCYPPSVIATEVCDGFPDLARTRAMFLAFINSSLIHSLCVVIAARFWCLYLYFYNV